MYDLPMVSRFRVWLPLSAVLIVLLSIGLMFAYGVPSARARLAAYAEDRTFRLSAKTAAGMSGLNGAGRERQLELAARTVRESRSGTHRGRYYVRADGAWLAEAMMVIVGNAVKYSERGGRVVLRFGPGFLTVEDEGEGIKAEDLPRVFDRFYQGEYSSGGLGMGLSICKELVEKMGGKVSIESEEGSGTKIAVELPEVSDG